MPEEANISLVFTSITLTKSAAEWAQFIVSKYDNRKSREDMSQYVKDAGYDIKDVAQRMQDFYSHNYCKN